MMHNPLALYDLTCERLRVAVTDRLPDGVDAEAFCAETAYWICLSVTARGEGWEAMFHKYTDAAMLAWAAEDAASERREPELALVREAWQTLEAENAIPAAKAWVIIPSLCALFLRMA